MNEITVRSNLADAIAEKNIFPDYRERKSAETIRRQDTCLTGFSDFLGTGADLTEAAGWIGVSWGLVDSYKTELKQKGYAVGSINVKLSTLRTYAKLAFQAGTLDMNNYARIRMISGYSRQEGDNLDAGRDVTRIGDKKADPASLTHEKIKSLYPSPDTDQGLRDRLILSILYHLGLRVGECHKLTRECFDLNAGTVTFYRAKVGLTQTHNLNGVMDDLIPYLEVNQEGTLWKGSSRHGGLTGEMSLRAMSKRVSYLGRIAGLEISPHDIRHFWATDYVRSQENGGKGKGLIQLQEAGGWASLEMPRRYIERAKIANE